jgi:hypothetical protein
MKDRYRTVNVIVCGLASASNALVNSEKMNAAEVNVSVVAVHRATMSVRLIVPSVRMSDTYC